MLESSKDNTAMETGPVREARSFQFSLRSLILFVTAACIGLASCANWPVDEREFGTETTTGHWWIFDWSQTHRTVQWIVRRPTIGEFAARLGLFVLVALVGLSLFRERNKDRHSAMAIATVCLALSFVFASAYAMVVVLPDEKLWNSLDYGPMPFQDPGVLLPMSIWASIGAVVVFPFTFLAFRKRRLLRPMCILAAIVLAEILIVTPLNGTAGFFGSFIAYALALIVAMKIQPATSVRSSTSVARRLAAVPGCDG
jgi:hypothetical protein